MVARILKTLILLTVCFSTFSLYAIDYNAPVVNRFGQVGLVHTHSAKTLGLARLSFGVFEDLSFDKEFVKKIEDSTGTDILAGNNLNDMVFSSTYIALAFGITRYLDISAMLPVYADKLNASFPNSGWDDPARNGYGDLAVQLKWQYPPYPHRKFFEMAYYGEIALPTGTRSDDKTWTGGYYPRHIYYLNIEDDNVDTLNVKDFKTSRGVEFDMKMLWTFDFMQLRDGAPVEFHMSYGVRWTPAYLEHLFLLNSGLSYRPASWITLFTEFSGETRIANVDRGFKIGDDPLRLTPGITFTPPGGMFLTLGADISLASTEEKSHVSYKVSYDNATASDNVENDYNIVTTLIEPRWSFIAAIGWTGFVMPQDQDKDGIKDKDDRCPKVPEDYDGFEDADGCPEYDNDNDGVPDSVDRCPNDPEDVDGFDDEDGCPEYDNDGDGINDKDDKCPLVPEDLDNFEDDDGCPENDNDNDGIIDSLDHCPDKPEDKDGFEDEDGCPEFDNDMDGIPDSLDQCPDKPETFNAYQDEDGCPDEKPVEAPKPKAKEIKRGRVILRGVNFESGRDVLTTDSYAILDQVFESLVEWLEVKIEIRGHTDAIGSRISNKKLSFRRAQSVRHYLITKGVASDRLVAVGMGEDEPIADNTTADGRALNRRVELHRID